MQQSIMTDARISYIREGNSNDRAFMKLLGLSGAEVGGSILGQFKGLLEETNPIAPQSGGGNYQNICCD